MHNVYYQSPPCDDCDLQETPFKPTNCFKCGSEVVRKSAFCDPCISKLIDWANAPYVDGGTE